MGCDIHSRGERKVDGKWKLILGPEPFGDRNYSVFAFLAGVRNYSEVPPISEPRGLPDDIDDDGDGDYFGDHSYSWLSLDELLKFDYDAKIEDRRVTRQIAPNLTSGAETCAAGEGKLQTWREYLGAGFFEELERIKNTGAERIVFGFDN